MSNQQKLQNWTKIAGHRGLYMRSHPPVQAKDLAPGDGEQDKTTVVLKTLEKRMGVILQGMSKR